MKEHYKDQFALPMHPFRCSFYSMIWLLKSSHNSLEKSAITLIHANKWKIFHHPMHGLSVSGFKGNPIYYDMMRIRKAFRNSNKKAIKETMNDLQYDRW